MSSARFFTLILAFLLQIFCNHGQASSLNCKELYTKGFPDPRFPEGENCILEKKWDIDGVQVEVYHYQDKYPLQPSDTTFAHTALQVFADVYNSLVKLNPTISNKLYFRPLRFILSTKLPIKNELAMVRIGHAQGEEFCPILVYSTVFGKQSSERQKQLLAHEVFHCIQDTLWREKIRETDKSISDWWTEGSAVWFSNFVYPNINQEYDYSDTYQGEVSLIRQEDPYSAYLFFQSLGNSFLGMDGPLSLIKDLPTAGSEDNYLETLLKDFNLYLTFHDFSEQITSNKLKDFNGGHPSLSVAIDPKRLKLKADDEQNLSFNLKPLTMRIDEIEAPAGSVISIERLSEDSGVQTSFRPDFKSEWNLLFPKYPVRLDLSCKAKNKTFELLSSYAHKEKADFNFSIKSEKSSCKCKDGASFDPCLIGDFKLRNESIKTMFEKIYNDSDKYLVGDVSGDYLVSVKASQKFSFTLLNLKANVTLKDDDLGDIPISVQIDGESEAFSKHPVKNELCYSDIGNDFLIKTTIKFPAGDASSEQHYAQLEDFSNGKLTYTCDKKGFVLHFDLPTEESKNIEYIFDRLSPL